MRMTRTGRLLAMLAIAGMGFAASAAAQDATIVRTHAGLVRGSGDEVRAFKGIPYAAPPVGQLRWRAPQPVSAWSGVRDATSFAMACMQPGRDLPMSEDCL